jgi:hypothetical protein
MIKDEQIPDEVVEAAAITELRELNGWPNDMITRQIWDTMHISEKTRLLKKARAAFAAGLAAWPGAWHVDAVDFEPKLILPVRELLSEEIIRLERDKWV